MTSMTGYAYEEKTTDDATVSVEIKSVNSRFLDLTVNLPYYLNPIESYFRNKISEKVARGKVDIFIRIKENHSSAKVSVDTELVKTYVNAYKQIATAAGFASLNQEAATYALINQEGIITSSTDYDVEKYKTLHKGIYQSICQSL